MDLSQYWSVCDAVWARKHIAVCSAGWASNRFLKPVSRTGFFENRFFWVLFVQYGALLARVDLHEFSFLCLLVGMIKHANSCRLLWFAKLYPPLPREKIFFTCPGERYYWKMTLFYDENSPSWSNNCKERPFDMRFWLACWSRSRVLIKVLKGVTKVNGTS